MIDLRRLQVLRAVAHFGSVSGAADALHMTASAASQQIRHLGRDLGVALLAPRGRGVELTHAARQLLRHADAIEERWQLAQAAMHYGSEPGGVLQMCGIPTAVSALLAPAAARLRAEHPALDIRISEAEPAEAFSRVFASSADIAVFEATGTTPPPSDPRFDQLPLLRDPFELLVPVGHPLADRERVALGDAAGEPWVLEMAGSSSRQYTLAACASAGFSPQIVHEARQWSVVAALVGHGHGVALVPRLAELPEQLGVVRIPLSGRPTPTRQLLSCIRRGSRKHPAIAAAINALHVTAPES